MQCYYTYIRISITSLEDEKENYSRHNNSYVVNAAPVAAVTSPTIEHKVTGLPLGNGDFAVWHIKKSVKRTVGGYGGA